MRDLAITFPHTITAITAKQVIASINLNWVKLFGGIAHCGKEQSMSRYIDADALKEKINTAFLSEIGKLIDNAPTIDAVSEWIPCSERLPSEYEEVLVCDKDGTMEVCDLETFGRGVGLKWTDKNGYECWLDVIAWMPLPKPYGEREGE